MLKSHATHATAWSLAVVCSVACSGERFGIEEQDMPAGSDDSPRHEETGLHVDASARPGTDDSDDSETDAGNFSKQDGATPRPGDELHDATAPAEPADGRLDASVGIGVEAGTPSTPSDHTNPPPEPADPSVPAEMNEVGVRDAGASDGSAALDGSISDASAQDASESGAPPDAAPPDAATPDADVGCERDPTSGFCVCDPGERQGPNGDCYYVDDEVRDWHSARAACQARGDGWDLVSVQNRMEDEFIVAHLEADTWMGASDAQQVDSWRWVRDGSLFWIGRSDGRRAGNAYVNWADGEPTGGPQGDECGRYRQETGFRWADTACDATYHAACQGPPNRAP